MLFFWAIGVDFLLITLF